MTEPVVDRVIHRAAVWSANRHTRRGFLGRIGAATAGLATAGVVVAPREAHAMCAGGTVTCYQLWGVNGCQSHWCDDGSWCVPPSHCDAFASCGSRYTRWRDCCIRKTDCTDCRYVGNTGRYTCCSNCIYGNSCDPTNWTVRCRYHSCC